MILSRSFSILNFQFGSLNSTLFTLWKLLPPHS